MSFITLAPKGSFHIGEPVGIERQAVLTHIPADTLFAALCTAWAQGGEDVTALLSYFMPGSAPPLFLTSAFPCLYRHVDGKPQSVLRFYPRPMVKIVASKEAIDAAGKDLKKAAWVSEQLFQHLCAGKSVEKALGNECFGPGGVWVTPEDLLEDSTQRRRNAEPTALRLDAEGRLKPLWKQWDVPRVTLDRVTGASTLYHIGRVTLAENVGLWFAARGDVSLLRGALDRLADSGLGGLRSTGHGAFTWGWTEEDIQATGNSGYGVTLARYAPCGKDEVRQTLQQPHAAYSLVSVGGWCVDDAQHAWRRQAVRMISEGSVIGIPHASLGQLVDVAPKSVMNRPVYRYGYAFPMGIAPAALPEEVAYV